jgi:hypothetical protein
MTADSDASRPILSAAERARLRSSVDVSALERFLAEIPEEVRPGVQNAVVLHFSRAVSMADIRDFLLAVGNEDTAAAVDRAIAIHPTPEPGPDSHESTPANKEFSMEPPTSPRLRALWDAIEPPPPASS